MSDRSSGNELASISADLIVGTSSGNYNDQLNASVVVHVLFGTISELVVPHLRDTGIEGPEELCPTIKVTGL